MAVVQSQTTVPSDGTPVVVLAGMLSNASQINLRNTGSNAILIGPQTFLAAPLNLTVTPVVGGGSFTAGTYFWQVTTVNSYGESTASSEVAATIAQSGRATVQWDAVPGATNYKVYRSSTSGGESTTPALKTTQGGLSYTDTGSAASSGAIPSTNTAVIAPLFPLNAEEYLGFTVSFEDTLIAQVVTPGTAGQITILTVG